MDLIQMATCAQVIKKAIEQLHRKAKDHFRTHKCLTGEFHPRICLKSYFTIGKY